jgi:hypothetical protein
MGLGGNLLLACPGPDGEVAVAWTASDQTFTMSIWVQRYNR